LREAGGERKLSQGGKWQLQASRCGGARASHQARVRRQASTQEQDGVCAYRSAHHSFIEADLHRVSQGVSAGVASKERSSKNRGRCKRKSRQWSSDGTQLQDGVCAHRDVSNCACIQPAVWSARVGANRPTLNKLAVTIRCAQSHASHMCAAPHRAPGRGARTIEGGATRPQVYVR
jgi:hypothetical protein